jgi:YHYH protein
VTLSGNGLPSSPTGVFPIAARDPAYAYDRNPNAISASPLDVMLPARPERAATASCAGGQVGVSLLGVPIFSAFDATLRDAAAHEVQDACGGHPQNRGTYHFHSLPACLDDGHGSRKRHSLLAGYALDGFGIYGYRGEGGKALTDRDLDACHGHTHMVRFNGKRQRVYHYHATREFPYLVGCFRGTPISTGP